MISLTTAVQLINHVCEEDIWNPDTRSPRQLIVYYQRPQKKGNSGNRVAIRHGHRYAYYHVAYVDNEEVLRNQILLHETIQNAMKQFAVDIPVKSGHVRMVKRIDSSKYSITLILKDYKTVSLDWGALRHD